MSDIKIGSIVKIASNRYDDYGDLLGKTGTVIAGGAKFQGNRRFLIELKGHEQVHIFEYDLKIFDMKYEKEDAIALLRDVSYEIESELREATIICRTFDLKLKNSELMVEHELDCLKQTIKRILSEACEELDPNRYHI